MTDKITPISATGAALATSSGDKLMQYSVTAVQQHCRKMMTPIACVESDMPSLAELRKSKGEGWCLAYVAKWIANLQDFLNVSAKMNDAQVAETAFMIVDDFWALNIADINLIFANAKRGQYGQLYGRIDGSIIYGWFQAYFEDRCNACEGHSIRQAERLGSDKPVTDAKVALFVKMLIEKKKTKQQCPSSSE